jgi:hypothetical protein
MFPSQTGNAALGKLIETLPTTLSERIGDDDQLEGVSLIQRRMSIQDTKLQQVTLRGQANPSINSCLRVLSVSTEFRFPETMAVNESMAESMSEI